jgi:hypothetical protein
VWKRLRSYNYKTKDTGRFLGILKHKCYLLCSLSPITVPTFRLGGVLSGYYVFKQNTKVPQSIYSHKLFTSAQKGSITPAAFLVTSSWQNTILSELHGKPGKKLGHLGLLSFMCLHMYKVATGNYYLFLSPSSSSSYSSPTPLS